MSLQPSEPAGTGSAGTKAAVNVAPAPDTVTTGPIFGSRKVYAAPKSHPHLRVPFREIALSDPKEAELLAGNVPARLRRFVAVTLRGEVSGRRREVVLDVLPDVLGIGGDEDWIRMPMRPATAQRIADRPALTRGARPESVPVRRGPWRGARRRGA